VISFNEELVFRVLFLEVLGRHRPVAGAVAGSALFAAAHAAIAPDAAYIAGVGCLGLLCAAAYLLTRTIWLPFSVHWAWDAAQDALGQAAGSGATSLVPVRPGLALGPLGYPEGGLVAMAALLAAAAGLWVLARRPSRPGDRR
jgi:membrane protease YdiL (CAAX protease family)